MFHVKHGRNNMENEIMSLEEYYKLCELEKQEAYKNPCCVNCKYCYNEYGYYLCKLFEMPNVENPENDKCDNWQY